MRSPTRFKLLVDYGGHLAALVRSVDPRRHPVAYLIDLDDEFGLVWATALRERFGRPDAAACLALARFSTPRGRAIATGCAPAGETARLASKITAGLQERFLSDATLAELIEVELKLGRPPAPRAFRVLVVADHGAEVAAERLDHPSGKA